MLVLQGNFGAQLRFGAANFRVPSERGSPPGIFKCARPRSTGTPRNRGRAREGKEHFKGGFDFFQKFSKGRTSVPDTRDLEPHCRRPCPPLREKWCGGGGGDDPICLPRKKLGGKALRRGSGTAGEKSEISPRELDCVPPPPTPPCSTPLHPPILGQKVMRGSWRGRPHLPSQKILGGKARRRGRGTAGGAQGRKKGTQGRVSEIFKCNKTC